MDVDNQLRKRPLLGILEHTRTYPPRKFCVSNTSLGVNLLKAHQKGFLWMLAILHNTRCNSQVSSTLHKEEDGNVLEERDGKPMGIPIDKSKSAISKKVMTLSRKIWTFLQVCSSATSNFRIGFKDSFHCESLYSWISTGAKRVNFCFSWCTFPKDHYVSKEEIILLPFGYYLTIIRISHF